MRFYEHVNVVRCSVHDVVIQPLVWASFWLTRGPLNAGRVAMWD